MRQNNKAISQIKQAFYSSLYYVSTQVGSRLLQKTRIRKNWSNNAQKEQLIKKQEDLDGLTDENTNGPAGFGAGAPLQRRESIWNGLAEI